MRLVIGQIAFAVSLMLGGASAIAADVDDPAALREQLQALESEIEEFREMLETTRGERAELEDTLEANEKEISEILKRIEEIQQKIETGENKVSSLNRQETSLERARAAQQTLIKAQIRAAWKLGDQEYLKVVLNQEDPAQLARMLTYYDFFNRARAEQIAAYRDTIASLAAVREDIRTENDQLTLARASMDNRRSALEAVRAEKKRTLTVLNREIARAGTELSIRERDRERLEALLERILASVVNLPTPRDTTPFADRKGELMLPVSGRVANPFGSLRTDGKLRWNGVFIEAERGTPVSAIHYGRVVFSDWLRGFGLLLIINHGDGYMSLYGHNEVLYRETGDWVTAGETISTVGDTGGQQSAGLYFEIRHAGQPTNPQNWCRARPASDSRA